MHVPTIIVVVLCVALAISLFVSFCLILSAANDSPIDVGQFNRKIREANSYAADAIATATNANVALKQEVQRSTELEHRLERANHRLLVLSKGNGIPVVYIESKLPMDRIRECARCHEAMPEAAQFCVRCGEPTTNARQTRLERTGSGKK